MTTMTIQMPKTISEFAHWLSSPISVYVKALTKGKARMIGEKARLLSAANRSAEMTEISLPEFVAISDFIDKWQTLSKMTATSVLRILIEVM